MPLIENQPDALARTYARSLYELAEAAGGRTQVESCLAELEDILEVARGDARFSEFLSSRSIGASQRAASLEKILKGRCSDLVLRFLQVVNKKGRLGVLPAIAAAFDSLVQEQFGRVEVDVFTAQPATPESLRDLKDRLTRALGKEVVVHPYTERAMIGGVKIRLGDQLVDASVATRLRGLKDQLDNRGAASLRARIGRIIDPG